MNVDLIPQFLHKPPEGYFYVVNEFKRNVFSIWLHNTHKFDYNHGKETKSIWGFYNYKKCKFFAPVNSNTVGKEVVFSNTRPFSSMQIKRSPLESALYDFL